MRIYTIHLPPPSSSAAREAIVIREGFNWWALLFGGFWALANRMWLLGIVLILATAAISFGLDYARVGETAQAVILLAVAVFIGAQANDWRRAHLARKGWKEAAVIAAADRDTALRRYLDLAALGPAPARRGTPPGPAREPIHGGAPA